MGRPDKDVAAEVRVLAGITTVIVELGSKKSPVQVRAWPVPVQVPLVAVPLAKESVTVVAVLISEEVAELKLAVIFASSAFSSLFSSAFVSPKDNAILVSLCLM